MKRGRIRLRIPAPIAPTFGGFVIQPPRIAIAALLTPRNVEDAARSIGVAPETLLRWLKFPEFQAAYG
jgi:hypothetical protein